MRTKPRVLATRRLPGSALARLGREVELTTWPRRSPPSASTLAAELAPAEGLLCTLSDRVDAALLAGSPRLRVISSVSVGVDHVDLDAATARRIPVGYTPGVLVETTADLAFALLLAAARRVGEGDRFVREGRWRPDLAWQPDLLLGADVHGATLGILGMGAIGTAVARRALGFGMRVLAWSRTPRATPGVEWRSLSELFPAVDFVSIHLPLSEGTRGLLDGRALAQLRPGAILVNTARGGIVDEDALVTALRSGRLAAAGLDVFASEPLPLASRLRVLPNVVLTPHLGSASFATRARMADLAVENLLEGLAGRPVPQCANPAVYERGA